MDDVLHAREQRMHHLEEQMVDDYVYLVVKANTPGFDKRVFSSYFLARFFKKYIVLKYGAKEVKFIDSLDGPYYIMKMNSQDSPYIKHEMMEIEEDHPLGRYIDIDVYHRITQSISRNTMGKEVRKCFVCEEDAVICGRMKRHTLEELFSSIDNAILQYLFDDFRYIIYDSITLEAMLHPKFGLVTEYSRGSHPDMDYALLEKAKEAITDYLALMVLIGFVYDLDRAFKEAREIGKVAEESMYTATQGVNCYKGLIFVMGVACVSIGHTIRHQQNIQSVFDGVAYMCRDILLEFQEEDQDTFGKRAFFEYHFSGIRGEVHYGFESVQKALKVIMDYSTYSDEALMMTLIEIVRHCEDTVLLKRAGNIEEYRAFKDKISNINTYDLDSITKITEEAIEKQLSIGGSADLLSVTILCRKVLERYIDEHGEETYRRL